jgi:hypothetical protein
MLVFINNIHSSDNVRRLEKLGRWSAADIATFVLLESRFCVVPAMEADMYRFPASDIPRVIIVLYRVEAEIQEIVV